MRNFIDILGSPGRSAMGIAGEYYSPGPWPLNNKCADHSSPAQRQSIMLRCKNQAEEAAMTGPWQLGLRNRIARRRLAQALQKRQLLQHLRKWLRLARAKALPAIDAQ